MQSSYLHVCGRLLSLVAAFVIAFCSAERAQANVSVKVFKDIVVIGDSLADGLHSGLYRLLKEGKTERKLSKKTGISSGLEALWCMRNSFAGELLMRSFQGKCMVGLVLNLRKHWRPIRRLRRQR